VLHGCIMVVYNVTYVSHSDELQSCEHFCSGVSGKLITLGK
jgi:hypothetical protein